MGPSVQALPIIGSPPGLGRTGHTRVRRDFCQGSVQATGKEEHALSSRKHTRKRSVGGDSPHLREQLAPAHLERGLRGQRRSQRLVFPVEHDADHSIPLREVHGWGRIAQLDADDSRIYLGWRPEVVTPDLSPERQRRVTRQAVPNPRSA